jgi:glycosyltransferase involved in cell wall biosynthesis
MKKILILNWRCPKNPLSGGAEKVTLQHAKAWVKEGHEVIWLAGGYKCGKRQENIDGVTIYRYGNPVVIYLLAPFIFYFKFKGEFDLIIDEIHGLPFFTPLWAWKTKKIAFICEVAHEIWDEMYRFPVNYLGKQIEKFYFYFYKKIPFLTISQSTKDDLFKMGIAPENIKIITPGLFLNPADYVFDKEKQLTLLFISRLVKMKGIEISLRLFSRILDQIPDAKLWVVGKGNKKYVEELKKYAKKLKIDKQVIFRGFVNEPEKTILMQKAHFLIHTSIKEGFGLTVLEANSQGTPAMVFNSYGLKDIVQDGINGYRTTKGYTKEMTEKIISTYRDEVNYLKLAKSSIAYSKKFNWKKATKESVEMINELMGVEI